NPLWAGAWPSAQGMNPATIAISDPTPTVIRAGVGSIHDRRPLRDPCQCIQSSSRRSSMDREYRPDRSRYALGVNIAQSLENLKLEQDAIALYDALASIDKDPRRQAAFRHI